MITPYWAEVHAEYSRRKLLEEARVARLLRTGYLGEPARPAARLDRRLAAWTGLRLVRAGQFLLALGASSGAVHPPEPAW